MLGLEAMTVLGVIVLVALIILFFRTRSHDIVLAILAKRAPGSILATRGHYVEGLEQIEVAMSLTKDAFLYENADLEAKFDLDRIDEIEYTDELSTGRTVGSNCRVLLLRSHGATFEFVLAPEDCKKWQSALPAHRQNDPALHAVS